MSTSSRVKQIFLLQVYLSQYDFENLQVNVTHNNICLFQFSNS